jgi:hypothetical protein
MLETKGVNETSQDKHPGRLSKRTDETLVQGLGIGGDGLPLLGLDRYLDELLVAALFFN